MKILVFIIIAFFFTQCRERYDVPFSTPDTGFLVVEGFINTTGETNIKLSRTTKLAETNLVVESAATVAIQAEDNTEYILPETDGGTYTGNYPTLDKLQKYRLNIRTSNGKEYVSSYSSPIETPEIDSLTWTRQDGKLRVFVNSHDATGGSLYYKWEVDQTWEINSAFPTNLKFNIDNTSSPNIITVDFANSRHVPDSTKQKCWQTVASSDIMIATTAALSENKVYVPVVEYPEGSFQFDVRYSANVKQVALSKTGYEFYRKMQKNTETGGSIFDTQPTELQGNITSTTNPSEMVIGYVEVCNASEKRIFISNSELPGWNYPENCVQTGYYVNDPDSVFAQIYTQGLYPTFPFSTGLSGNVLSFYAAPSYCVDCTLRGSSEKPSFWP